MREDRGITLVALIVTIIVIIILTTVSITAVFGETGMIQKSYETRAKHENLIKEDEIETNSLLRDYAKMMNETVDIPPAIDDAPTITQWDSTKVDKVKSSDGVFVPVPKGFTVSTIEGETSVQTGFVIKEGKNGAVTHGINEFVWIPVDNIDTFCIPKADTEYREPDVITGVDGKNYDAKETYLQQVIGSGFTAADFKKQLQNEFKEMKSSVQIYGGFYIGRYETGNLNLSDSTQTAVVKKYNRNTRNANWYTQYVLSKKLAESNVNIKNNVKTHMIWGGQWDWVLNWFKSSADAVTKDFPTNSGEHGNYKDSRILYRMDSVNSVIYEKKADVSTFIPTGGSEQTKINNIYDMAGNVSEWTMEAYSNNHRVKRGGAYTDIGALPTQPTTPPSTPENTTPPSTTTPTETATQISASSSSSTTPTDTNYSTYGSRMALYML